MGVHALNGTIKHYDWGGYSFIPELLKIDNSDHRPFAEYWMSKPELSYLFKVLDVRDMLSIQVHPERSAAEKEFARENAESIAIDAPHRNYKDANHKPELMVALSDFWLLHGFKPAEELVYTLLNVVELRDLLPIFNQSGYKGLYQHVMVMPQSEVDKILRPLIDNIASTYEHEAPEEFDEDYWALKAYKTFSANGSIDRGIFSIYLFNIVKLRKGEGIFQDAGVPHAYLQGQNVEIMANSDNVLRGGLTTKHIDVKELMKHVKFEATEPVILKENFNVPVNDFTLESYQLKKGEEIKIRSLKNEIILAVQGSVSLKDIKLEPGCPSAFIDEEKEVILKANSDATVFKAGSGVS